MILENLLIIELEHGNTDDTIKIKVLDSGVIFSLP